MKITIITLFPQMFPGTLGSGLIGKARFELEIIDLKHYSTNKSGYQYIDERPFGGGEGMLICPSVIENVMQNIPNGVRIFPSPCGPTFNQSIAERLAQEKHLVFLCGRYEGVDCRPLEYYNFQSISLGDFILCGGEVAAMTMIETIIRLQSGTLSNEDSIKNESFYSGLLEYDQFCELRSWNNMTVPEVLLGGNHKLITEWRYEDSLKKTAKHRPDLLYLYCIAHLVGIIIFYFTLNETDIKKINKRLFFKNLRKFRNN